MNITSSEYITSFTGIRNFDLPLLPSIGFIGRSNVGKSSLMNHILKRKSLVKTSSTPGKTQTLNYFLINKSFYFVDLPGYGYAKVPLSVKNQWQGMMKDFFSKSPQLILIVQLVDIRHEPSEMDKKFQNILRLNDLPQLIIANKADKIKRNQLNKQLQMIKKQLELQAMPIAHSLKDKVGVDIITDHIESALSPYLP